MRLQRWFNDHLWRPAKGYTAKDGTWKFVGSSALLFGAIGAVVIAGGGAVSHHQASPWLASSRGSRSALGWREPDPTTTTQPPASSPPSPVVRSEPSGRGRGSARSASPRSAPCDRPSTCPQLRQCENGGSYQHGTSSQFDGAYQFADKSKWGMTPAQQDAAADQMYAQRGSQPWPVCGRFLR